MIFVRFSTLAAILFPILAIVLVAPDFPYWDQIDYVDWFVRYESGLLTVQELFRPQNEYVQVLPNIVFFGLGILSRWDPRWEMVFSWLVVLATFLLLIRLFRQFGLTDRLNHSQGTSFVLALILFSPIQLCNWLNGVQLVYFVPNFLVVAALSFNLTTVKGFWYASLCCFFATLSSANGVATWLALFLAALFAKPTILRSCGWLLGIGSSVTAYFLAFKEHVPLTDNVTYSLSKIVLFFMGVLGRFAEPTIFKAELEPYRWWQWYSAKILGLFVIALVIVVFVKVYRQKKELGLHVRLGGLVIFSLVSLLLVSIGRAGHAPDQSLTARYVTFAVPLYAALFLILIRSFPEKRKLILSCSSALFCVPFVFAAPKLKGYNQLINEKRKCWASSKIEPGECIHRVLYPIPQVFLTAADKLEKISYSRVTRLSTVSPKSWNQ